jgi:hypothetical protein
LGGWFDARQTVGLGFRYFDIGDEKDGFRASSGGDPILARPFFNADLNTQDALLVAYPGISVGSVDMVTTNEARGFDALLHLLLLAGGCNRLDLIGGYQYSRIDDGVLASDSLVSQDPNGLIPVGTVIDTRDQFDVENEFNGGSIGLLGTAEDGRLTWRLLTKVGFGNMRQETTISGTTVTTIPGGPSATQNFGLLALPTNIGTTEQDEFAVVPELNVSVGYKITNQLQLTIGYSYIYWSKVALAGEVIDTTINPTQMGGPLVGPPVPTVLPSGNDGFWYQGLDFGLNWRF